MESKTIKKTKTKQKAKTSKPKISKTSAKNKVKKDQTKQVEKEYLKNIKKTIEEYNHNGKKTIAIFNDVFYPFVDGVINVMDNHAKRLQEKYNVVVCVPRHKNEYIERDYPILYFKSVYFELINYAIGQPSSDREFNKLLKSLHIDLVHVHSPFMVGRFALKEARKRDIPIIATFHSQFKQDFQRIVKSKPVVNMLLAYIMEVFNGVDEVWTMNEATKKTLLSYNFKGKVRIVSNATDFKMPEKNVDEFYDLAVKEFDIKPNENVYCFVGRLIFLKNILLIAESLGRLKKKGIPFKMIYIGDGQDRGLLEEKVKKLKLEDDIILAGKIMDKKLIASVFANSSMLLFPSIYDTDGIVKYEAAAFETPTLFLKNSNASYDIDDNKTGVICEGKPEIIARRLEYFYNHPEELKQIGKGAKEGIYNTWEDVIEQASEIYAEVIKLSEKDLLTKKQLTRKVKTIKKKATAQKRMVKKIKSDIIGKG